MKLWNWEELNEMVQENEDDIPFMNYRTTWCLHCKKVLYLQDVELENRIMVTTCGNCGREDGVKFFVTGGYKNTMLVWNDVVV